MKLIFSFFKVITLVSIGFAQVPNKLSYQSVIRGNNGSLVSNTAVAIRISLLKGSINGNTIYSETFNKNTNTNGLVSLEIGSGMPVTGDFNKVDWTTGPYFIKTETDPSGGMNYAIVGTSELLSVPYALLAKSTLSVPYDFQITGVNDIKLYPGTNASLGLQLQSYMYDHENIRISVFDLPTTVSFTLDNAVLNYGQSRYSNLIFKASTNIQDTNTFKIKISASTEKGRTKEYFFNLKLAYDDGLPYRGVYQVYDSIINVPGSGRLYTDTIAYSAATKKIHFRGHSSDYSQTYLAGKFADVNNNLLTIPIQGNGLSYNPSISGSGTISGTSITIQYSRRINNVLENRYAQYFKISDYYYPN